MADRSDEELRTFAHLAGVLSEDFPPDLQERCLQVVVADGVLDSDAGQVLVLTLARLAPRFCHRIDFVAPARSCTPRLRPLLASDQFHSASLAALARLIWPSGQFTSDGAADRIDVVLRVGDGAAADVGVGIDAEGAAIVTRSHSAGICRGDAIFGALSAAAIASAQIAKLLYPEIVKANVEPIVRLESGPFGGPLDPRTPIVLDRPLVAGVGAVGCALVYALIAAGASGKVVLLDPDVVSDSNLMRYVLFDERHLGRAKIEAAKALVAACGLGLELESAKTVIQSYLSRNPCERGRLSLVVSAVDTYDARRAIAGELPRAIINAGTTPRDFTVSRHGFGDGLACLACLYPQRREDVEADAVMARELGLNKAEGAELKRSKEGLTLEQLERIARARSLPHGHFANYVGEPIDSLYHKEFCARVAVSTARGEAVAPLAYGSALAGFLLAHAVAFPEQGYGRRFRMDFVRGLSSPQRSTPAARASCSYCGRPVFRNAYQARWSGTSAHAS